MEDSHIETVEEQKESLIRYCDDHREYVLIDKSTPLGKIGLMIREVAFLIEGLNRQYEQNPSSSLAANTRTMQKELRALQKAFEGLAREDAERSFQELKTATAAKVDAPLNDKHREILTALRQGTQAYVNDLALVAKVFTEWDRRFREEPDKFISGIERLQTTTPETYGDACAPYFLEILKEIQTGKLETVQ